MINGHALDQSNETLCLMTGVYGEGFMGITIGPLCSFEIKISKHELTTHDSPFITHALRSSSSVWLSRYNAIFDRVIIDVTNLSAISSSLRDPASCRGTMQSEILVWISLA